MPEFKAAYDEAIAQLTGAGSPFAISQRNIAGVDYRMYDSAPASLREVFEAAAAHSDREFLVYEGERFSFNDMLQQAASIGHQLVNKLGIGKGDRVAIAMRNYPEWMSTYIARPEGCQPQPGSYTLDEFIAGADSAAMPGADIDPEDLVMILYTSGTTGVPKGAVSTHRALCQAITNFEVVAYASAMINPDTITTMMESGFEPTQMLAVPLFHVSGLHAVFLTAFKAGRRVVMMYKWNAEKALELIETERVTICSSAPAMLLQLLESPEFDNRDTSSLFSVGAGRSDPTQSSAPDRREAATGLSRYRLGHDGNQRRGFQRRLV